MKHLYLFLVCILIAFTSNARTIITAVKTNGKWRIANTWDLNRVPIEGDSVVIPTGKTVTVDNLVFMNDLFVAVTGTLKLNGGALWLGNPSTLLIPNSGSLSAQTNWESVFIGGTLKYLGFLGDLVGPLLSSSSTGNYPFGFSGMGTLPVTFIGFNVASQGNAVLIDWSTSQEQNSSHYEVERSVDGFSWVQIGRVTSAGYSRSTRQYRFSDYSGSGTRYYRVRQVDLDGNSAYSAVKMLKQGNAAMQVSISSGASNTVYLHFSQAPTSKLRVMITAMNGQLVTTQRLDQPVGQQLIRCDNTVKGFYVVTITDENGIVASKQIVL